MKEFPRLPGLIGLAVAIASVIIPVSSCSSGGTPQPIEIQMINVPAIVTAGQSVSLTANVGNDSGDAGIDWSCGGGACGTFAPPHTASAAITVFTAPSTPGTVTVTATATGDASVVTSHTLTVVPADANVRLNGAYVFSVQGADSSGRYAAIGTLVADGNGFITGGRQDYADETFLSGPDPVTGVYAIGPDGRGSITLVANNASYPQGGVETFGIALTSDTHALIIQFGGTATSSGHLDAQAASALDPAAVSGAFAFVSQGIDMANSVPITSGGVLSLDAAAGTVSGGVYYENDGGSTFSSGTTGTMTAPDAFGRGTITLDLDRHFAYYAVQAQVLRLIETDLPAVMTAGSMYGQGDAGANATFSNGSLTGTYVFFEAGGTTSGPLAMAGQFTSDGAGNFTAGTTQLNNAGVVSYALIDGQGRYTMTANGVGTLNLPPIVDQRGAVSALAIFAVSPALNLFDPNSATGGGGALVMDYDSGAVASGFLVPQSPGTFDGEYALNLQFVADSGENDWVGRATAAAGAFTGTVDVNVSGLTEAGLGFAGTYAADSVNPGRWTGSFTVAGVLHNITYFQVSGSMAVIVDTDAVDVGIGILEKQ
jgi:hypothetical protein